MEFPTKRSLGGGLLFTAGAVLGREFIFWAYGKVLDAGANLARSVAKSMTMPSSIPWLDVFSLLLMITGGWLLISGRKTAEIKQSGENQKVNDEVRHAESGASEDAAARHKIIIFLNDLFYLRVVHKTNFSARFAMRLPMQIAI